MPQRFLMCPPLHFNVSYRINQWMEPQTWTDEDYNQANRQWMGLMMTLQRLGARVELMTPIKGLPDMVFVANGGIVKNKKALLPQFRHPERVAETPYFSIELSKLGYDIIEDSRFYFEGAGDVLWDRMRNFFWCGSGFRSAAASSMMVRTAMSDRVVSLNLIDPRFYHLDTCFCILSDGEVMYYPGAFDKDSLALIENNVKPKHRIIVEEADAYMFACNSVPLDNHVIMSDCSWSLEAQLSNFNYDVVKVPLTAFHKSGGSAACLTLRLI